MMYYYIVLKFPFLYVGLRKTIKDMFKLVGEKKIGRENPGNFKLLEQSTPRNFNVLRSWTE